MHISFVVCACTYVREEACLWLSRGLYRGVYVCRDIRRYICLARAKNAYRALQRLRYKNRAEVDQKNRPQNFDPIKKAS